MATIDFSNPSNQRLGRYQLQSVLGQGSMGTVYQAFDENMQRIVAIKVLNQQVSADGDPDVGVNARGHLLTADQ